MPRHLFIASLGNPQPYTNTLHSAGHLVIEALQHSLGNPAFQRNLSVGSRFHLFRSPAFMNDSGNAVARAYHSFVASLPASQRRDAQLVLLHDELEAPLGKVRLRVGGSHRGHNGLKSVAARLGQTEFIKIGIGIGRPESREKEEVARYVLRNATTTEVSRIQSAAGQVESMLDDVAAGSESENE